MTTSASLFEPLTLGNIELKNRILMAPLTRARTEIDHIPTAAMAEHYAQRASSGLIIAEATMVMEGFSAFNNEPGIYSEAQIEGWKKVTEAVHQQGGKIVLQLWHGGRACHPDLNGGAEPMAASPLAITTDEVHTPTGKQAYTVPQAMTEQQIETTIAGFKQAAINAKTAGFDGVEVHCANGYLLDTFLRDGANQRQDQYGGSLENRARFLFAVLDQVIEVWGSDRVGLRVSPLNGFNSMRDSDPVGLTTWLAQQLNRYQLAFWHLVRSDMRGEQIADIMAPARQHYQGRIIGNMGYSRDEANQAIGAGQLDAVAFGVPYLANPDLPKRFALGATLNEADPATFYSPGAKGYNDYPMLAEA